jgi:hypothetical protein
MLRRVLTGLLSLALLLQLGGCMVNETKPLPKINAVQAQAQIPQDELLDVGVHEFDVNITEEQLKDTDKLAKQRVYPEIRKAEARFIPSALRSTLESSGQWGAVRVVPKNVEFVDVTVTGRILESTGAKLAVEVSVYDSTGRQWITKKRYESPADTGSYKTDASLRARDPFQNVYSQIANDMVAARDALVAENRRDIRRVTELRFAQDLAPKAMDGYVVKDAKGLMTVARLPAENDPYTTRIDRIRERDGAVVDTVNGYYANFSDAMRDSYGAWRRTSFDEIEKETRARNQARTRTILGAAAVVAAIFVPGQCASNDYNCRRIENAARTAGAIGGTAAVLSGLKKYSDAKIHAQALKELSETFQSEVQPQVVDVEGRTLRLTGTADEQYKEWRELLQQLHTEETGAGSTAAVPANSTSGTTPATAATPASTPKDAAGTPGAGTADPKAPVHVAVEKPESGTPVRP